MDLKLVFILFLLIWVTRFTLVKPLGQSINVIINTSKILNQVIFHNALVKYDFETKRRFDSNDSKMFGKTDSISNSKTIKQRPGSLNLD